MKPSTSTIHCLQRSLVALAMLGGSSTWADADTPWYLGASSGPNRSRIDDARISQSLNSSGLANSSLIDQDRDHGYKVFGGYQFNRFLALEGSYFDLGTFAFTASTTPPGTLAGDIRLRGLGLDAVVSAPLTDRFSLFAKVGANYTETRDRFNASGAVTVLDSTPGMAELNPKIGLGMQYALTDSLSVRAELERFRVNDAVGGRGDVDHLSIGLVYSWGNNRPKVPVAAVQQTKPVPTPVAPAQDVPAQTTPEPVPVVVVQVLPIVLVATEPPAAAPTPEAPKPKTAVSVLPKKVTLSADSLFAFDKSTVSPDGKQQLDEFGAKLKKLDYEFVTVTGHTDRLGDHLYNLRLSARRAQAVGTYLNTVAGIPTDKMLIRGQNGSNPVTQPGDCVGVKANKALIACLQPDRRVDLEVTGTR